MTKLKFLWVMIVTMLALGLAGCSDDDAQLPRYSAITITPQKEVYHVGDVITCSITEVTAPEAGLKTSAYWWYASWWFADPDLTADFQSFDDSRTCTSSTITLTQAGEVTLYFFGRLEYPSFDFRKVEEGRKITVVE
jgi:hypothetical protein